MTFDVSVFRVMYYGSGLSGGGGVVNKCYLNIVRGQRVEVVGSVA